MSDLPPFRSVRRGYDPDQVTSAITELSAELAAARQAASERATELTHALEREAALTEQLRETAAQLASAQAKSTRENGGPSQSHHDVGTRVATILTLAVEEGEQRRSEADHYAEEVRAAAEADAARMAAAAVASADSIVQQATQEAAEQREATVARTAWLEHTAEAAHREAAQEERRLRAELDETARTRDEIRDHLAGVLTLLTQLDGELDELDEPTPASELAEVD